MKLERLAAAGLFALSAANCGEAQTPKATPEPISISFVGNNDNGENPEQGIFTITRLGENGKFLVNGDITVDYSKAARYMRRKGCNIISVEDVKAGEVMTVTNPTCLPIK